MQEKLAEIVDLLYGFRKIIAFFSLLIISVVFRIDNLIDGGQFVDLMKAVALSFFAANGVEHFTSMVKDHLSTKLAISTAASAPAEASDEEKAEAAGG